MLSTIMTIISDTQLACMFIQLILLIVSFFMKKKNGFVIAGALIPGVLLSFIYAVLYVVDTYNYFGTVESAFMSGMSLLIGSLAFVPSMIIAIVFFFKPIKGLKITGLVLTGLLVTILLVGFVITILNMSKFGFNTISFMSPVLNITVWSLIIVHIAIQKTIQVPKRTPAVPNPYAPVRPGYYPQPAYQPRPTYYPQQPPATQYYQPQPQQQPAQPVQPPAPAPVENTVNNSANKFDELAGYKKLLDVGAITQEEFDKKKEELLK